MENMLEPSDWFVVQVKPRHEKSVSASFEYRGFQPFLPLYLARNKWSDRTRDVQLPLFPGYVFCKFNPARRTPILSTPGVFDIVRCGRDPVPVDPTEISALQKLMRSGLLAQPWPHIEVGQPVEIEDGPLAGCQGVVVEIKKEVKLVLSVTLLHRSVLVELDREWVKRISPRPFGVHLPSENRFAQHEPA